MDKLLIIGAGIGQVPLLKKAQARGIHVTVATIPGAYPCIELADDIIYKNIYDRDGIVEEAKKRGITAVISDQNDLMMPTVAYVADKLDLPGNKFETVMAYCNKNLFRETCDKALVPSPKHTAVYSVETDFSTFDCPFPWIVKPADSQSSIGIKKISSDEDLRPSLSDALDKSPTHSAIVEEFFEGKEIVCEGFVNEGRYYLLQFGDREYFDLENAMIPNRTLFPSLVDKEILNKILSYEQALTRLAKPSFAIVHSEYLVNEDTGDIRIVESALRGGGVYISSDLIPMATGIDINEVLLDKALGRSVDVDAIFRERKDRSSAYVCFYLPKGMITSISGVEEIKQLPFVDKVFLNDCVVGSKTAEPTYKGARMGPILISGDNRSELRQCIAQIEQMLSATVVDKNGIKKNIIWK